MSDGREWTGVELLEASNGRLQRHSIYVLLSRLEKAGHVSSRYADGEPDRDEYDGISRRRLYRITTSGRKRRLDSDDAAVGIGDLVPNN